MDGLRDGTYDSKDRLDEGLFVFVILSPIRRRSKSRKILNNVFGGRQGRSNIDKVVASPVCRKQGSHWHTTVLQLSMNLLLWLWGSDFLESLPCKNIRVMLPTKFRHLPFLVFFKVEDIR